MNRRQVLKILFAGVLGASIPQNTMALLKILSTNPSAFSNDSDIKDYIYKINNFNEINKRDLFIEKSKLPVLKSTLIRLKRVQNTIGYGNFGLLGIDDAIKIADQYPSVESFTKEEMNLLEMTFYRDSAMYGFLGEKQLKNFTNRFNISNTIKIRNSGHYLYKGNSFEKYKSIKKTIGKELILTSGLRSIPKQLFLFLNKTIKSNGNLSMASRSLAPPGYSLHGVGDFDVGQKRLGAANFSIQFTYTPVYKKLIKLGFADFRYTKENNYGVRFEPWHIKV